MRIVIGQPGLFPWWGTFAKAQITDMMIHLDHVSWQKGGYLNRFLVNTDVSGKHWCTVPLQRPALGTPINQVRLLESAPEAGRHLDALRSLLGKGQGAEEVTDLLTATYGVGRHHRAADVAIHSTERVAVTLAPSCRFLRSSELDPKGRSTSMLISLIKAAGGDEYVFGPGRAGRCVAYLDLGLMRRAGIRVGLVRYGLRRRCSILQDLWLREVPARGFPIDVEWL